MKPCVILLGLILVTGLAEGLTVIHDSGKTLPIADYVPQQSRRPNQQPKRQHPLTMNTVPVRTPSMRPGKVAPRTLHLPHVQVPLFIVGSDAMSKAWLTERRDQLIAFNAVGMLVAAESEQDIRDIKALAHGLRVFPASGEAIARELKLHHYPALISKTAIEQ